MRQIRHLEDALEGRRRAAERRVGVPVVASGCSRSLRLLLEPAPDLGRREIGQRPLVPRHVVTERLESARGGPVVVGHDGEPGAHRDHFAHPGDGGGAARVVRRHLAAEHRAAEDAGHQHAGPLDVDAEAGSALDLLGDVEARHVPAQQREGARLLQRDLGGHGQPRGAVDERAVAQGAAGRLVPHAALFGRAVPDRDAPLRRGRRHEHLPCGRAGLPQRPPVGADAVAAGGELLAAEPGAVAGVGSHPLRGDRVPVDVELFRDEHRHGGHHALPHLELGEHDAHGVVRVDPHPDVRLEGAVGRRQRGPQRPPQVGAHQQSASRRRGDGEERAPIERRCPGHHAPSAAR